MREIKNLITDVDGSLTDGKIYIGSGGESMKAFNIKDGCGIHDILIPSGIIPVIITGRSSEILEKRCEELGITQLHQGVSDKLGKLREIIKYESLSKAAYIGDDINDLPCMREIKQAGGIIGCPADAVKEVKEISDFISERNGGNGAVREFIEWIMIISMVYHNG